MRSSLEYYMARLDDWPFEVGVDLEWIDKAPVPGLPERWHVRLELNHPTENGLCTAEEQALLLAIQEELLAAMKDGECVFVAAVTHRKARTLVFYASEEPTEQHPVIQALGGVKTHLSSVRHANDPQWVEYKDALYPNESFIHQIKDRRLLREFEAQGDDCSEVHSIEPRFVGLSEDGAKLLSKSLETAGFGVKAVDEVGQNGQREWQVTGVAESPLALSILDDFRRLWLNMAAEAGGRYDGWSAEVVPVTGRNNNTGCDGHLSGVAEDYEPAQEPPQKS